MWRLSRLCSWPFQSALLGQPTCATLHSSWMAVTLVGIRFTSTCIAVGSIVGEGGDGIVNATRDSARGESCKEKRDA